MKTINIISGIVLAAGLFVLGSCSSRLDIPQHSVSSIDSYYQTDAEAEEGVTMCYTSFRTLDQTLFNCWWMIKEYLTDDNYNAGEAHTAGAYQMNDYTFSSDISYLNTIYNNLYKLVYNSNVVIEKVTGSSSVMKRAVAEAKVFRAWAYFELVTMWGPAPKVDHLLTDDEYLTPNSTVEELWALIESDLKDAIDSGALTEKSSVSDKTFRITKQYAQALLGKTYLFQKKYGDAATMLENVISSGKYALQADFSTIGTPQATISEESLFKIHYVNDNSNSGTNNNMNWVSMGLRAERFSYTSDWFGPTNTWGFLVPTGDLYDAFVKEEGVDGYRLKNSIMTVDDLISYGATPVMDQNDCEGYWNYKFRVLKSSMIGYFYAPARRVMRYAEVLLLAAEAQLQNGNAGKAADYVNQVRTRAKLPAKGSVTMEDIKTEKRLELFGEGVRYQDLVRWGDAAAKLGTKGQQYPTLVVNGDGTYTVKWTQQNTADKCGWKTGKHEYLPFPATECAVNPNITQNPGW